MQKNRNIFLKLEERRGFAWYGNDQCRVRGSFCDSEGNFYCGNAMVEYFGSAPTYEAFCQLVAVANGVFSVIRKMPGECWLATDLVRSLPLFYRRTGTGWAVSDQAMTLLERDGDQALNWMAGLEFRGAGYVTGSATLVETICQVQAGEVLRLGEEVDRHFHHSYRTDALIQSGYDALKQKAGEEIDRAFERMVRSLEDRTAVVPLSGGYDSRLIAVMLKRYGHNKVICFTYGRKGNEEAALSEKVARKLGFPWYFVEYNQELVADYMNDPAFQQYYPWAANLTSMFFLQEYFAVKYLHDYGMIPGDAVFIPGHSGDFLGGSQFAKHQLPAGEETSQVLARRILEVKYHHERYSRTEQRLLRDHIVRQLEAKGNGKAMSWSVHEDWDLKEKLAKFNVNSVSTYTFFGYTFRLPYYDRQMVDFFRDLDMNVKQGKRLYDDLLVEKYFVPFDLQFEKELQIPGRAYVIARFRKKIKKLVPRFILAMRRQRADVLYYREITAQLREDLVRRGGRPAAYGSKYNKMIIDWYLLQLKEKFSKSF